MTIYHKSSPIKMHSSVSFSGYARRKTHQYHTRRTVYTPKSITDVFNNPSHTAIVGVGGCTCARWNVRRRTWNTICAKIPLIYSLYFPFVTNRRQTGEYLHFPHMNV